jgi:Gpi18-like mannosyltransferase
MHTGFDHRPERLTLRSRRRGEGRGLLYRALPSICWLAGIRLLGLVCLAIWSEINGKNARILLSARWDSLWYARIISEGYDYSLIAPDGRRLSDMAFFPLFPWMEKAASEATTLSLSNAGILFSAAASLAAAAGIFSVAAELAGERAGLLTVILWAALPVGIVQSMAYSESLFTALASWALYMIVKERWIAAGVLASLSGLTRPTGLAVVVALWVACVQNIKASKSVSARVALAAAVAPVGGAAYALWVGSRVGNILGYLDVQKSWGNGFDGGIAFSEFIGHLLWSPSFLAGLALVGLVVLLVFLYVRGFALGISLPVQAYTGTVALLALCTSSYFGSKPRLLIPAFGLLIPVAILLAKMKSTRAATLIGPLIALSAVYGAFWLNGSGPP